jgi:hypothetical protein
MTISPLVNTDRKGGAYAIMLQQFRRAIGVGIVWGQAKHKLARLHYVRETAAEAALMLMCVRHIIDGNQVRTVERAGTHNMFQKDMELLNNSETVMISVCLRGARI